MYKLPDFELVKKTIEQKTKQEPATDLSLLLVNEFQKTYSPYLSIIFDAETPQKEFTTYKEGQDYILNYFHDIDDATHLMQFLHEWNQSDELLSATHPNYTSALSVIKNNVRSFLYAKQLISTFKQVKEEETTITFSTKQLLQSLSHTLTIAKEESIEQDAQASEQQYLRNELVFSEMLQNEQLYFEAFLFNLLQDVTDNSKNPDTSGVVAYAYIRDLFFLILRKTIAKLDRKDFPINTEEKITTLVKKLFTHKSSPEDVLTFLSLQIGKMDREFTYLQLDSRIPEKKFHEILLRVKFIHQIFAYLRGYFNTGGSFKEISHIFDINEMGTFFIPTEEDLENKDQFMDKLKKEPFPVFNTQKIIGSDKMRLLLSAKRKR